MPHKKSPDLFGLYIHWPYCLSKCPYCDFASCVTKHIDEDILFAGYIRDLKRFQTDCPLTSIFFGGGTPSLMSPRLLDRIMGQIRKLYTPSPDIEISLEANPDAIDPTKMRQFFDLGINRLSIGIQSLNEKDLQFLGRKHSAQRAIDCVGEAKQIFHNINIDLIYARPNQSVADWQDELKRALALKVPHYSLYQLTIEEGTVFYHQNQPPIKDSLARKLYLATDDLMMAHHFIPYEVSNYAKAGFECRHNLTYWLGKDYIGIGPAAHGRLGLLATENPKSVATWLKQGTSTETLTPDQRFVEKVLMGMRLKTRDFPTDQIKPENIAEAIQKKWIIQTNLGIRPTRQGTPMLNRLIQLLLR